MKLPTLDKFLFKYELETGGLVLGWLSAVFSGIAVLVIGIVMILSIQSAVIGGPRGFGMIRKIPQISFKF